MENYILLIVGISVVIFNKPYYQTISWWQREVLGIKNEIHQWFYQSLIIFVGIFFISIFFIKKFG